MLMNTGDTAPPSGKARTPSQDPRAFRLYHGLIAASVLLPLLIFAFAAWQNWRQLERLAGERAEDEGFNFLGKPFTARDLSEKIRTVLAG